VPGTLVKRPILLSILTLLLGACSGGGNGGGDGGFIEPAPGGTVTVSGTLSYEFVPPNLSCAGLNFSAIEVRPIRAATVVLLNGTGGEMARMSSSDIGEYSFAGVPASRSVRIRVLAESKSSSRASWDVEVRDNVDTSPAPPLIGNRPMYSIESSLFDSGSNGASRNLTAETGWGGSSYTGARAAAPFAILDTIYTGTQFLLVVDPDLLLPPLDVFWSVNNTAVITGPPNVNTGELGTSFYSDEVVSIFLTGDASSDTDEFDDHIVGHEWAHFLDDTIFRTDSPGGPHGLGDSLDSRLAWSEGWPSAFAAMFLNDPAYCETGAPGTNAGFEINAEAGFFGGQGWFDEVGMTRLVYDLWDTDSEGTDTGSIGFAPIYEVMTGGMRTSPAWANIFTFATELKELVDANGDALIDSQLGDEQTVQGALLDIWGTNETNDGGALVPEDVLPIYVDMVADGTSTNICSNSQFDPFLVKEGNKLSEYRYIRLDVPVTDEYNILIASTTPTPPTADTDDIDQSDPDMDLYLNGNLIEEYRSGRENIEEATTPTLLAGTYVADLRDYTFEVASRSVGYPSAVCFDVSFSPTP
jgi:hypothetical protein